MMLSSFTHGPISFSKYQWVEDTKSGGYRHYRFLELESTSRMTLDFNPTGNEQKVLDSARQLLGSNLSDYLLSGLGETKIIHCRAFIARGTSRHSENVTYQFEMINDLGQGLPRERDPLVLAALLLHFCQFESLNGTVRFPETDVIEMLKWPQNAESISAVKRALERYLLTAFYLIDPTINEEALIFGRYARFKRLLVGYEATWLHTHVKRTADQGANQFLILPEFTQSEILDGRRFLGVEFQSLREMHEIPC